MPHFKQVPSGTALPTNYKSVAEFKSKGHRVDEHGKKTKLGYEGREWCLFDKGERTFSCGERVGRIALGCFATIFSLGFALISQDVRNLFKGRLVVRLGEEINKALADDYIMSLMVIASRANAPEMLNEIRELGQVKFTNNLAASLNRPLDQIPTLNDQVTQMFQNLGDGAVVSAEASKNAQNILGLLNAETMTTFTEKYKETEVVKNWLQSQVSIPSTLQYLNTIVGHPGEELPSVIQKLREMGEPKFLEAFQGHIVEGGQAAWFFASATLFQELEDETLTVISQESVEHAQTLLGFLDPAFIAANS